MKINKKGLTSKEVQDLIDEHIKWKEWYKEFYLPMWVKSKAIEIYLGALRESKNEK